MKFKTTLAVLLTICFLSCDNDDPVPAPLIQPSATLIEMEAEGGETAVSFSSGDWHIAEVINQKNDLGLHGDIYSPDGEIIRENTPLSLQGQGKLQTLWKDKGFVISRDTPSSLKIDLKENSSGEVFGFVLLLESGEEFREIAVNQKESEGYSFERIEFSLKQDDGDSLYVKRGHSYKFNILASQTFEFSPYGGVDVYKHSTFTSEEDDAFVWVENDSVMVEIPGAIYDGELIFNGNESVYNSYSSRHPHGFENRETLTIPGGESQFTVEQQWRKRTLSYSLHLVNNRTGEEKMIEGKWFEVAPTGGYEIIWKD